MSKLKIEHGASKVNWVPLKVNIEEPIVNEIDLMCRWSQNERKYIVNELLRFALNQSQEFQKYKEGRGANSPTTTTETKSIVFLSKGAPDKGPKIASLTGSTASRHQPTES
jgi:hypothetical protein